MCLESCFFKWCRLLLPQASKGLGCSDLYSHHIGGEKGETFHHLTAAFFQEEKQKKGARLHTSVVTLLCGKGHQHYTCIDHVSHITRRKRKIVS